MATPLPAGIPPGMPHHQSEGGGPKQVVYHVYQMGSPETGFTVPTSGVSKSGSIKVLRAALLFFVFGTWVVYIAGIALTQAVCNGGSTMGNPWTNFPLQQNPANCTQYFGLFWWSIWLQFIVLIGFAVTYFFSCMNSYRTLTMNLFLMSSVLLFFMAHLSFSAVWSQNEAISFSSAGQNEPGQSYSWFNGAALLAAGAIGSLIVNFIYIIWYSYVPQIKDHVVKEHVDNVEPEVDVKVAA